ncbi:hypothetical protein BH10PAT1_BH10PAT1_3060 [soil metagenome]
MGMEKKMKVAFLSFYNGEIYRGVETYVYELSNKLTEIDVDVTVYQNGSKLKNSKYKTVSISLPIDWTQKELDGRFLGIAFTDYFAKLVGRFTKIVLGRIDKDIDILITTNGSLQVLFTRLWCLLHGKKHIAVGQSGLGADDKWNLMMLPDVFVALTNYQKEWAKKFSPFVKVNVIPNGVDLKKFNLKNKALKIDLPKPIILTVGALEEGKRLDLVIKVVAKTKASLLIVGKGKLRDELQILGDKLMKNRFKIISLPFEDMPTVYSACDLFTYPTVPWESFGIVIVEAMASNLAVVATDDPIRNEIVGEAGLFVDPTNIDKYAETLEKALEIKWGTKPREQSEKFSWDDIAIKYKKMFEKIMNLSITQ